MSSQLTESTLFPFPVAPIDPKIKPLVSTVQPQSDGSLLVGFLFAKPALLKITLEGNNVTGSTDLKAEEAFDKDFLGITGGLRGTRTGDTAFATLHRGGGGFFSRFKTKTVPTTPEEVWNDIANDGNGLGFSYKHSLVQILKGSFQVRRNKEAGVLLDAAHIGDFIFGIGGAAIFREPYLNPEKRYMLREDLGINYRFHKVEDGVFWLLGNENKLMKLNLTDNKALPTTKRLPDSPFRASTDSQVDGWLYAVVGTTLLRIRVNVENRLDEVQEIKKFSGTLPTSVASQELQVKVKKGKKEAEDTPPQKQGKVWVSTTTDDQSEIYEVETVSVTDNELLPEAPIVNKVLESTSYTNLNNLVAQNNRLLGSCHLKTGELALFVAGF